MHTIRPEYSRALCVLGRIGLALMAAGFILLFFASADRAPEESCPSRSGCVLADEALVYAVCVAERNASPRSACRSKEVVP